MNWHDIIEGATPATIEELDATWETQLERMDAHFATVPNHLMLVDIGMLREGARQIKAHGGHTQGNLAAPFLEPYKRCLDELGHSPSTVKNRRREP